MIVYISLPNKITLAEKDCIRVKDIASIYASCDNENDIKNIKIMDINKNEDKLYYINIIDVVRKINSKYNDIEFVNLGKQNIIVEYIAKIKEESKIFKYSKIIFVCLVLFFGSMTTIVAFHVETQLIDVLENMYTYITGRDVENNYMLSIPYSLGIGIGIATFFNHIGNKKISNDPTPVEIELTKYEGDLIEAIVDKLSQKENNS